MKYHQPQEFRVVSLRECPTPAKLMLVDTPERAVAYWRRHVTAAPWYNPDVECAVVLLVNARHRAIGHVLVGVGTLDSVTIHARDVFRAAIVCGQAYGVVIMHCHPSGDPDPSAPDITISRQLERAGRLLNIPLLDSIIIGHPRKFRSLRAMNCL
ncbi:MAG: JAB domain-containing protein [Verrucomicrobiota bacterium]